MVRPFTICLPGQPDNVLICRSGTTGSGVKERATHDTSGWVGVNK